jgi:CheY-like chemotaxis protein
VDPVAARNRRVRLLKADSRTTRIPVVALTSFAMTGDREWFLEAGFDGSLEKPISVAEFAGQVRGFCAAPGSRRDVGSGSHPPRSGGR